MKLKTYLAALAVAAATFTGGTMEARAMEGLEIGGDVGMVSQYVWRGATQTSGMPAVQGSLWAASDGFSAGLWFSNAYTSSNPKFAGRDVVEYDVTLDYSGEAGAVGYSVGGIYYLYQYDPQSNFAEVYAGASMDAPLSPSITLYYTVDDVSSGFYKSGDIWVDLGISGSAGGADLSGTLSYVSWESDPGRTADFYEDGFSLLALGVSKDLAVGDVTMTPSATVSVPIASKSSDGNRYIYGTQVENEFIAGLAIAY